MFGCYAKALVENGGSPVMLITWMRGFDQGRQLTEVRRENSDRLVQLAAAETTQQGRPDLETGSWLAEERIRNVLLPLSGHNGITMHRGGSFRFERGRRKHDGYAGITD